MKKAISVISITAWTILLALIAPGCEDIYGPQSHPPSISDMTYIPMIVRLNSGGGQYAITWTVNYNDEGKDIIWCKFTTTTGIDTTIRAWLRGSPFGVFGASFNVPTSEVSSHTFTVRLIDSAGAVSNKLVGVVQVIITDDAQKWTERSSGTSAQLNRVAWTGTQFVAVGSGGTILTSTNGSAWIRLPLTSTEPLWGIASSGNNILAVGEHGMAIRLASEGPILQKAATDTTCNFYDVAWSGISYVAVGKHLTDSSAQILASTDGVTWSNASVDIPDGILHRIVWTGRQFVAIGNERSSPYRDIAATSTDGMSWTSKTLASSNDLCDMAWTGSYLVAIGARGAAMTSTDGMEWVSTSSGASSLNCIVWSGNSFVAIGDAVYSSSNGSDWTKIGFQSGLRSGAWSGFQYVFVGPGGKILTSP